jgi:hypothetical protein
MANGPRQSWGREGRRARREQARELAKEIMRQGAPSPAEARKTSVGFILTCWGAFVALIAFGYELTDIHILWASGLYVISVLQLLSGTWLWFGARWNPYLKGFISIVVVVAFVSIYLRPFMDALTPTYLYLVPTPDLIDAQRRAFFVEQSGPRSLQNVEVTLLDNKGGTVHVEKYPDVDPEPQNPLDPRYFWITPSSPWDEDYTITVTAFKNPKVVQHMVVRSTRHVLQFAIEVNMDGKKRPLLRCRDHLLPDSYSLATAAPQPCDSVVKLPENIQTRLNPLPYGAELPDGSYRIQRLRELLPSSELEAQSEDRHLWEYQKQQINGAISRYRGSRLLIFATNGVPTRKYANEFRDVFLAAKWKVDGPKPVPAGDERIIDVQVSCAARYCTLNTPNGQILTPRVAAVLDALTKAGVKHRNGYVYENSLNEDVIVLWVGPKSPNSVSPDECLAAELKPRPGAHDGCEMISQTPKFVPFPPP